MRPLLHGDIDVAARVLMLLPPEGRGPLIRRIIAEACAADAYRKRHGRAHALWGDGTLMAALARPCARAPQITAEYLECQFFVLEALLAGHRNTGASSHKRTPEITARKPREPASRRTIPNF